MRKRLLAALLTLAMVLALFPAEALAADVPTSGTCGDNLTWTLSGGTLTISGTGTMTNWDGASAVPWSASSRSITAIVIANGITSIGDYAFMNTSMLTSVSIPNSVTSIGNQAFYLSNKLTGITIPDSVTAIGNNTFSYCSSLTNMTIPGSVASIGESAFSSCSKLISVRIANGVTSIEHRAFYNCKALSSMTIPNSVTSIGTEILYNCSGLISAGPVGSGSNIELGWKNEIPQNAFYGSNKLVRVTIPDGITKIGGSAFYQCSSLTSAELPDSVTSIGACAFASCRKLTNVNVSNSVTSMETEIFSQCDSLKSIGPTGSGHNIEVGWKEKVPAMAFRRSGYLKSVTIPDGVTSIGTEAFYECGGLTSVLIHKGLTRIEDSAFYQCRNLKDVYYSGSEADWKKISFGSFNSFLTDATIHYNYDGVIPVEADMNVPAGKYCIWVVDSNGKPISGASVSWNSTTASTDDSGKVYFDQLTTGTPVISVSKSSYVTWSNQNSNWSKSNERFSKVVLYTTAEGAFHLSTAMYSAFQNFSLPCDLLTKTKTLNLKNDGNLVGDLTNGEFYLSCTVADASGVDHYELWQGDKKISSSTDGKFLGLSVKSFSKGGDCFIRVVPSSGTQVDTHINLEFAENSVIKTTELNLSAKGASFSVGDDVPFVGGSTFTCNFPFPNKVVAVANEDKIQFGFNVNLAGGKSEKEQMKDVKKFLSRFNNSPNVGLSKADRNKMKSYVQKSNQAKFFKDATLDFLGYAEADLGGHTAKGQVMLVFSIDAVKADYNTVVWVIPVTVQFGVSLGATGIGSIQYDWEHATLTGGLDFAPSAKLTAFGGVGVSKVAGVGAYGSATLDALIRLIGTPEGLRKVDLTGELGVKAYLGYLEYKRAFAHQTWHLYTANTASIASQEEGEAWNAGLRDASQYTPSDLGYLEKESPWLGEESASLSSAEASVTLTPLLENTYRNAQPVMVSGADGLYGAFVRADSDGTRYLVCTRFNGSSWAEPVRVDPEAILDDAPTMCVDESGTIWLAYAKTTQTGDKSLLSYAQNQEIVVGTVDPDTLAFTPQKTFSGSGYVHMQQLAVMDGTPVLTWVDGQLTDEQSVFTPESETICCASYTGGAWSAVRTLKIVTTGITGLAVGKMDETPAVAYTSGKTLYSVTLDGSEKQLAQNVTGRVTYGALPGGGAAGFLWSGDNCLNSSNGQTYTAEGITGEYAVVGDKIYYSMATENGANLVVKQFDVSAGGWSLPVQLTDEKRYLENLSAAAYNGKDYVFGMSTLAAISEDTVEDAKNLVWSAVTPVSDLRLDAVDHDAEAAAGSDVPVTVTVTNAGSSVVNSFEVLVDNVVKTTVTEPLNPGESRDVSISLTCPNALTAYRIEVSNMDDYYPEDNAQTIKLGYADVSVSMQYHQIGTQKSLLAIVTNEGVDAASGSVVIYDANGKAAAESLFEDLESGATTVLQLDLSKDFAGIQGGDVSAVAELQQEELYTHNNSTVLHINEPVYHNEIREAKVSGDTVSAKITCAENTEATAYCASYNADGKMLKVEQKPLTANAENAVTFTVHGKAVRAKIFMLGTKCEPLCESVEVKREE